MFTGHNAYDAGAILYRHGVENPTIFRFDGSHGDGAVWLLTVVQPGSDVPEGVAPGMSALTAALDPAEFVTIVPGILAAMRPEEKPDWDAELSQLLNG